MGGITSFSARVMVVRVAVIHLLLQKGSRFLERPQRIRHEIACRFLKAGRQSNSQTALQSGNNESASFHMFLCGSVVIVPANMRSEFINR